MDRKVVLIIGAGERLGAAIATKFLKEGFKVLLLSRNINNLNTLKSTLSKRKGDIEVFSTDVANTRNLTNQFEIIKSRYKLIDAIVYNAANIVKKSILDESEEGILYAFKVNVIGLWTTTLYFEDYLRKSSGALLVTGGGIAIHPKPDYASLSVTSAALLSTVRCLSSSLKKQNVFVGTILVNGVIDEDCPLRDPKNISEQFWRLYKERKTVEILL